MGFFKRLFGPSQATIDEWLKEPRELPSVRVEGALVKDIPAGDPRWAMSREFADVENPNHRIYLGAVRQSEKIWAVIRYTFDSKMPSGERLCDSSTIGYAETPREVIALMRRFEAEAKEKKWLPAKQTKSSVINFANHFGLHVDNDGNIVNIKDNQMGGGDSVFITRGSLDALFNSKGLASDKKYMNIDSWPSLYSDLVNSMPHDEITLDDLVGDSGWTEEFEDKLRGMTQGLIGLPAYFLDEKNSSENRKNFIQQLMADRPLSDDFSSKEKRAVVTHIIDSAFLVTFLRLAADVYQQQVDAGMSPEGMAALKKSGALVKQWSQKRFGVDEKTAKKIEGIMLQGDDPYAPGLSTQMILEQMEGAKARVKAAEEERKAEEARLALIAKEKREAEERRLAAEKAAKEAEEKRLAEEKKAKEEAEKKAAEEATAKKTEEKPAAAAEPRKKRGGWSGGWVGR